MNKTARAKIWSNYYAKNKEILKVKRKKYREENIEKYKIREKQRYIKDPEFHKERHRKYSKENREKINTYIRNRYATDTQFKIKCCLRARLNSITRNLPKNGSALKDLGCSIKEFKKYIENRFEKGMSWSNHSYKIWHIDHIKPLSLFNLNDRTEFLKACHYTNMQPMWALDNHKKGNRI